MPKDVLLFLNMMHNYIQKFDGSLMDAYNYPLPSPLIQELFEQVPHLMARKKANTYMFHLHEPIQYVYFLLDGTCCAEKYNSNGQVFTDTTRDALQIFSMMEAVTEQRNHTCSIRCMTDCIYAKIPFSEYMQVIKTEPELLLMSTQLMCVFFMEHLENTDRLILDTPRKSLLSRLYNCCAEGIFPITVHIKKEELAQDIHMNLRTLYRHLDKLYKEKLISSHKGKIVISKEQYLQIESELFDSDD